jgi:hypothetical protein
MRHFSVAALGAATTLLACATMAGTAYADTEATTGGATSVTTTTVILNGVANPHSDDSGWEFQYGTTTTSLQTTPGSAIGSGVHAVSAKLVGLTPHTKYFYRVLVLDGGYTVQFHAGGFLTFTTMPPAPKYGQASLVSSRLAVGHGVVSIPLRCTGVSGTLCKGNVLIGAQGKRGAVVSCAGSRFRASAGKSQVVRANVSGGCLALLQKARGHKLGALLSVTFTTHQVALWRVVTLVGS